MSKFRPMLAASFALFGSGIPAHAIGQNEDELAKQLSNPPASLTSVPLQFNYDEGYGTGEANGRAGQYQLQPGESTGKQMISYQGGARYYIETPHGGPWTRMGYSLHRDAAISEQIAPHARRSPRMTVRRVTPLRRRVSVGVSPKNNR
jgi:hypothetical protein